MGNLCLPYEQQPSGMRPLHPFFKLGQRRRVKKCNANLNEPENSMWRGKFWRFLPAGRIHAMRKGREESKQTHGWFSYSHCLACYLSEKQS